MVKHGNTADLVAPVLPQVAMSSNMTRRTNVPEVNMTPMTKFWMCFVFGSMLITFGVSVAHMSNSTPKTVGTPEYKSWVATMAEKQESAKIEQVKQDAETVWRAMKAQCAANQELVANLLHLAVIKLENGATRATVSYAIWKRLNDDQRERLGWAVRCHQTAPSVVRVVDVNGVAIGTM